VFAAAGVHRPAHGTAAHDDAEKAITRAVTTDCFETGYEVAVTKSDGSTAEVHLDSSFTAFQGGPGGSPPGH
jgi:hypothetical protein